MYIYVHIELPTTKPSRKNKNHVHRNFFLLKFNEASVRGHKFNLPIIVLSLDHIEAMIDKNKRCCSEDFYFAATIVK